MPVRPLPTSLLNPDTICDYADAAGLALRLADGYAAADAAILVRPTGTILAGAITTEIGTGPGPVVAWAWRACHQGSASAVLLLSVRELWPSPISEDDLATYRTAGRLIDSTGAVLIDWIHADGDDVRSFDNLTNRFGGWIHASPGEWL